MKFKLKLKKLTLFSTCCIRAHVGDVVVYKMDRGLSELFEEFLKEKYGKDIADEIIKEISVSRD